MNATRLRIVLIISFVVLLAAFGVSAWWAQGLLASKVKETDHARIDAQISQQQVDELKKLQGELEKQKDVVTRAGQIAATAQQYQYQDQVIKDVQIYAGRHGLAVSAYDFSASTSAAGSKAPAGTALTPFSVTLKGPIPYDTFMSFLRDVENNLTKIQVTSLTLTPNAKNAQLIDNPTISAAVYLKK